MSQFDPIVEEEPEEDDTGVARNMAGGTELHLPSAAPPDAVGGGGLQDRPTRVFNTERAEKAKGVALSHCFNEGSPNILLEV